MARCRFVQPVTTTLQLTEGYWIEVKKQLSVGERRDSMQAAAGSYDDKGRFTSFNNLEKVQPGGVLKGTTDWSSRAIVLDVPENTDTLNFGFYLYGTGEAWFCGFELQVVGNDVPVTKPLGAKAPANLDFTTRTGAGD